MWIQSIVSEKINVNLINTVIGPVSVIANDKAFSEKLAVVQLKNYLVLLKLSTLHRFKALLMGIYSTVSEVITVFLINTVLGQVSVIANDMVLSKN